MSKTLASAKMPSLKDKIASKKETIVQKVAKALKKK